MKISLCNEMFEDRPLAEVCSITKKLGYDGLELAPFTFSQWAGDITAARRKEIRSTIEDSGLEVVGLHWLFAGTDGLHLTSTDEATWARSRDYLNVLFDLCADLGGEILVLGSPKQRDVLEGQTYEGAWARAKDALGAVLDKAGDLGLTLCLEPLAPAETNFINTVEEGMRMVREIDHPSLKIHLDVKAMSSEIKPVADVIRSVSAEVVGHFHVNDENLYGPGMGEVDYAPIAEAVREIGWDKWLSVEVFKYDPNPETIARESIEYLRTFFPK